MAKIKFTLDTRKKSKSSTTGLYPIVLRVFHKKPRFIYLNYQTSPEGWDSSKMKLKKSILANKDLDIDTINNDIYDKIHLAQMVIRDIGDAIGQTNVDNLVQLIKDSWESKNSSSLKQRIVNGITLAEWGGELIRRKEMFNKPSSARWYKDSINAFLKFNNGDDLLLDDIDVTFLKNFQAYRESIGNSKNSISAYMRAVRAIYNGAIAEGRFKTDKNPFLQFKVPSTSRTKKRAIIKESFFRIKKLEYQEGSPLWHAKNYALIMFNCRGMNFADLVKLKVKHIEDDRVNYGRSKTGEAISIGMTPELQKIISYYSEGKSPQDYLFPANNDGSTKCFEKYKSQRRRMNGYLKIIAKDANIDGVFTTYTIRHSWATIAKYMGISTAIISEGLGHNSLRTTEIYLKSFDNKVLDEANRLIVS